MVRSPLGWLGTLVVMGLVVFSQLHTATEPTQPVATSRGGGPRTNDTLVHFTGFVLDDAQATWSQVFSARGMTYRHARLVLYTDVTSTGCGTGEAATGPFYCPQDEQVYLDVGFFQELGQRFGAPGEFARAYVIAHEVGHHVQKLLGISDRMRRGAVGVTGATGASVRLELQADCFAGVWARSTSQRNLLDPGDIESAQGAAAAVGDDRLQRAATGTVSPESFTHGTSAQRARWFRQGVTTGTIEACDTFHATSL